MKKTIARIVTYIFLLAILAFAMLPLVYTIFASFKTNMEILTNPGSMFPKKFTFKLELVGRRFHAYRIPGKDEKTHRKMSTISTESSEFNDAFKIYAEDGFEAFYLLDPKMISRILDISTHYKNKTLFCFVDNKLYILLDNGKDSFEPPKPSKPIDEQAELAKVSAEIKVITDFVDQLSLDRKLFK